MTSPLSNINFIAELFIAQSLLLYSCPKRKNFTVRMLLSLLVCGVLAYFFPLYAPMENQILMQAYQLLRFSVLLAYTIIAALVCYDMPPRNTFPLCIAGYAIQHLAYQITTLCSNIPVLQDLAFPLLNLTSPLEILIFFLVYYPCFLYFGRKLAKNKYYKNSDVRIDILAIATTCICIVLSRVSYIVSGYNVLAPRIYAVVCCLLALIIQFNLYDILSEKYEKNTIRQLWKDERRHYEVSKKMVDTINIKCHDLKYKLREHGGKLSEEERASIENAINIYDGMVKTGNEVLDVILAENHLQCQAHGIKFSFMGNGEELAFVNASDTYSLFGNALENAREAVLEMNAEKRVISLTITRKGDFVNIDLVNYFNGNLIYSDEDILTSKTEETGYHGFGIKSMQMLARKYNGDLRISVNGDLFSLGIYLLRIPSKTEI